MSRFLCREISVKAKCALCIGENCNCITMYFCVLQEYMKPLLARQDEGVLDQTEAEHSVRARQAARSVLYHCVSVSLSLLSPIMPFITEELWQRLQPFRSRDSTTFTTTARSSLGLQPYPCSSQLVRPTALGGFPQFFIHL